MTSSPASTLAIKARKMTCFAPPPMVRFRASRGSPVRALSRCRIASRSGGMPFTAVYLVSPASIAATAAALMWSGVSKSGSPTVRSRIVRPSAVRSRTRWAAATLADSRIR